MDFSLTEEQTQVCALSAQILGDHTSPDQLKLIDKQDLRFDQKLWQLMAEAGLLGVAIEEAHGGMSLGFETLCMLLEEAGKTVAPLPLVSNLVSAALTVQEFANADIKASLLPKVVSGETILCSAFSEGHSDNPAAAGLALDAGKLNGSKHMVPFAQQSSHVLLTAQSSGELVVMLVNLSSNGISMTAQTSTTGEPQYAITFADVEVSGDAILGQGQDAHKILQWTLDRTITANCAVALGVTTTMLKMTAAYTSEREQFGVPIATFQAVAHRAADCFIDVENLRLVTQQAASRLDQGQPSEQEVTIAKIWCGDVCHRVSQASQHMHGGIGVDRDYPLFRYVLWAKQLEMTLGSGAAYLSKLGDQIAEEFKAAV